MSFILNNAPLGCVAYTGFEKPPILGEFYVSPEYTGVQWVLFHWQSVQQVNLSKMPTLWYSEQHCGLGDDELAGTVLASIDSNWFVDGAVQ